MSDSIAKESASASPTRKRRVLGARIRATVYDNPEFKKLTASEGKVYLVIVAHAGNRTCKAWPSLKTMARLTGMASTNVVAARDGLVKKRMLKVVETGGWSDGGNRSTRVKIIAPAPSMSGHTGGEYAGKDAPSMKTRGGSMPGKKAGSMSRHTRTTQRNYSNRNTQKNYSGGLDGVVKEGEGGGGEDKVVEVRRKPLPTDDYSTSALLKGLKQFGIDSGKQIIERYGVGTTRLFYLLLHREASRKKDRKPDQLRHLARGLVTRLHQGDLDFDDFSVEPQDLEDDDIYAEHLAHYDASRPAYRPTRVYRCDDSEQPDEELYHDASFKTYTRGELLKMGFELPPPDPTAVAARKSRQHDRGRRIHDPGW